MAITPPMEGNAWKIQLFFNTAGAGFQDVFYYNNQPTNPTADWGDAESAARTLLITINAIHAQPTYPVGYRVTNLGTSPGNMVSSQASVLRKAGNIPIGPIVKVEPAAQLTDAVVVRLMTIPPNIARTWMVRGVGLGALREFTGGVWGESGGGSLNQLIIDWANANKINVAGSAVPPVLWTGRVAIKARLRPGTLTTGAFANPAIPLLAIGSTSSPGKFTYTFPTTAVSTWNLGDRFIVRGARLSCQKGANGIRIVTNKAVDQTDATKTIITTQKTSCCSGTVAVISPGIAYRLVYGLYAIGQQSIQAIASRRTGRPTLASPGRRPACAC